MDPQLSGLSELWMKGDFVTAGMVVKAFLSMMDTWYCCHFPSSWTAAVAAACYCLV